MSKKVLSLICLYVVFLTILAAVFSSCTTSRGANYQQHLSHKHTGAHYLNSNNKGCGWSNN